LIVGSGNHDGALERLLAADHLGEGGDVPQEDQAIDAGTPQQAARALALEVVD
jgi:hypothetical protein